MTFAIVGFVFVTGRWDIVRVNKVHDVTLVPLGEDGLPLERVQSTLTNEEATWGFWVADLEQEVRVHRALALQRSSSAHHAGDSGPSESDPSAEKDASPSNKLPHPEEESPERVLGEYQK